MRAGPVLAMMAALVSAGCSTEKARVDAPSAAPSAQASATPDLVAAARKLPPYAYPDCRFWPEACTAAPGEEAKPDQGRWVNFHALRLAVRERDVRLCDLAVSYRELSGTRPVSEALASCRRAARIEIAALEKNPALCEGNEVCLRNYEEWKLAPAPNLMKVCERAKLTDADRALCISTRQQGLGIR